MKAMGTVVVVSGLLLTAGGAVADDASLSAQELQGKHLYDRTCIYCHGPGVWGTNRLAKRLDKDHALLESRTDLTAAGIRAIVRSGVGSMPPLRKTELSDSDVDAIAAYLTRHAR
jgi:mono/diheme cytochrome c family protein